MKKLKIFTLVLFLLTGSALAASEYYHYRAEDRTLPVLRCPDEPLVISVGENSREKLERMAEEYEDAVGQLKYVRTILQEKRMYMTDTYESYLGREFLNVEKIDGLKRLIESGEASNISEAIERYKNGEGPAVRK